jgi:hypothetical protein
MRQLLILRCRDLSRLADVAIVMVMLLFAGCRSEAPDSLPATTHPAAAASGAKHRWFEVPIDVSGLPLQAPFVPLSCPIDLTALLSAAAVNGTADAYSIHLEEIRPDGGRWEVAVQFTAAPQPRPTTRALLPGTPPTVSYSAEYPPAQAPAGVHVAGQLSWAVSGGQRTERHYRLRFGVPRSGRFVQVPYPPQDLRWFDEQGRAELPPCFPLMQIHPQRPMDGMVSLYQGQELITSYHLGPTSPNPAAGSPRRPFLYPVNGPGGIPLTEFGKPHDPTGSHAHHYSLWVGHASVNGHDFWSEKGGAIVHEQLEQQEDGAVFCRLVQRSKWSVDAVDHLHERREVRVYNTPADFRVIDVEIELKAPGSEPVTLGKTSFGFLAARVAQSMTPFDGGGEIVNSRGDLNEQGAHLKRADWIDQSGPVRPGKWEGVAILDHPSNVNHPTVWHCRNDGWAGAAFDAEAPYSVDPAQPLRLRYRVVLHRGNAADGAVAQHFQAFAAQPIIRVGRLETIQEQQ